MLPQAVARWSLFDHKKVPSTTTFFCITLFYLSGTINSLLLRIARPELLLLTRRKVGGQPERQLDPRSTSNAVVSDMEPSPEPTVMVLVDGDSSNTLAVARVSSKVSV